jgi:hypothetical protein
MKRPILITIVLLCVLILGSGCMTEQQVGEIRTFSDKVDGYQNIVTELKEAFVADKIINEKTAATVDKVNSWLDDNQPVLEEIAVAVENAPDNVANKVAAGVGKAAPLIPPPYNTYALGISSLVAAFFGKKAVDNGRAFAKESSKRRAERVGRIKTINELTTMKAEDITAGVVKEKMYCNIGDERSARGVA